MPAKSNENTPREDPVDAATTHNEGNNPPLQPENELNDPSSPPCYLHEFPTAQTTDTPAEHKPVSELTPEEQMERFEKALKEDDWGHQPC